MAAALANGAASKQTVPSSLRKPRLERYVFAVLSQKWEGHFWVLCMESIFERGIPLRFASDRGAHFCMTPPHKERNVLNKNWQDLIKPGKINVLPGTNPRYVATIVAEPLERGFGLTLGNALRRVLLSSLQGGAVTTVHIDGVLHEFSSIPGVREDVTDIVLNIKEIALRVHSDGVKRMVLRKDGPGVARARDIEAGADVEILNPDLVICTLDEGATVRMELTANIGKGYVPAERNRPDDAPIGLIPVDSLYSPVRKVSYRISNTREGQILDYDKLTLEVETNGAVSPEDAVALSARIIQDQLSIFVNFEEPRKEVSEERIPQLEFNAALLEKGRRA